MKKVSVIIPLYNRASLVKETLDSLSSPLHPGTMLEIIVVDDGSTDGGGDMVEQEYPQVLLFRQKNSGAPSARNKGLSEATGELILFLDSDDLIEPNFFREKISALEKNPKVAAVYGPWDHFHKNIEEKIIIVPRHSPYPLESTPDYNLHLKRLLEGWFIIPHAIIWRKSVLTELKGFDTSLIINQDVDLLFRAFVHKNTIMGIHCPKALYRDHHDVYRTGNISGNFEKLDTILKLRKRFLNDLRQAGLLSDEIKNSIADFCFDYWVQYRKQVPIIAEKFYDLAKELNPTIQVKGGKFFQLISKLIGARNAVILKSLIK